MVTFIQKLKESKPAKDQIEVFWLGQAGFIVKTHGGKLIGVDPYLSEYAMRLFPENGLGFKRMMPPPCEASELELDILLVSHEHADHFDADSIKDLMKNGRTQVYANAPVIAEMEKLGLDMKRAHLLKREQKVSLDEFTLIPVDCDHGELAPEALGLVLDFGFTKLYYAGDTSLTPARLAYPVSLKPEIAILPINGAFGNLDGEQAAEYAGTLGCKVCIPCHFWTFPLHHGEPQQIIDAMPAKAPDCQLCMLMQGEGVKLP